MYVGIDLAASDEGPTGICRLNDWMECFTVYSDQEIEEKTKGAEVVAVDAPITRDDVSFRGAERALMKEYGPMLPLNTPGMKKLSKRALKLFDDVIETYPRAVEKTVECGQDEEEFKNEHEYDAYLCALTAKAYAQGECEAYGEKGERIVVPER